MQKKLDGLVGSAMSKSHRESLLISAAIVPEQAEAVLGLLQDITFDTVIRPADLEEMKSVVAYELEELGNKPDELLPEMVHGPAFYGSDGPGNSILSVADTLETIRIDDVYEARQKMLTGGNVFAVAAGIPHDLFLSMTAKVSPTLNLPGFTTDKAPLRYIGGERYVEQPDLPLVHIGLGFQGLSASHPDAYAQAILQMLLGGGGSFSAGGPGKGMYSRLYTQVLNRHHWVESAKVFCQAYSGTGLFGIHGSALPSHARELSLVMLRQMLALTNGPISPTEFARAKAQVRSAVLMGLESRLTQLEDLADQLTHRSDTDLENPLDVCARLDAVQPEDLARVAQKIVASGPPAVVAYGPLSKMPSYNAICDFISSNWH